MRKYRIAAPERHVLAAPSLCPLFARHYDEIVEIDGVVGIGEPQPKHRPVAGSNEAVNNDLLVWTVRISHRVKDELIFVPPKLYAIRRLPGSEPKTQGVGLPGDGRQTLAKLDDRVARIELQSEITAVSNFPTLELRCPGIGHRPTGETTRLVATIGDQVVRHLRAFSGALRQRSKTKTEQGSAYDNGVFVHGSPLSWLIAKRLDDPSHRFKATAFETAAFDTSRLVPFRDRLSQTKSQSYFEAGR